MPIHLEAKEECAHCGQRFKFRKHLQQHILSMHSDDRPWSCPKCNATFKLKGNMQQHLRRVHGEHCMPPKGPDYWRHDCTICDMSFNRKANYFGHMKKVHGLNKEDVSVVGTPKLTYSTY